MHKCPKIFTAFCRILLLNNNELSNHASEQMLLDIFRSHDSHPKMPSQSLLFRFILIVCIDIHLIRAYIFLQIKSRITSFSSIPVVKFTYCYSKTTQYCIEFDMIYYENSYCSLYKRQPLQTPKFS